MVSLVSAGQWSWLGILGQKAFPFLKYGKAEVLFLFCSQKYI